MKKNFKNRTRQERLKRSLTPKQQLKQINYVPQALGMVWDAAKGWTIFSSVLIVIRGVLPALLVYLTKEMVNSMAAVIKPDRDISTIMVAATTILLMALIIMIRELLGDVQNYTKSVLTELTQDHMDNLIHNKTTKLDMQFYESSSYFDTLHRASSDASSHPLSLLNSINTLLEKFITIAAMIGLLFSLSWWVPIVLILGTIPALIVSTKTTNAKNNFRYEKTYERRKANYFKNKLTSDIAFAELRIFDLNQHFIDSYNDLRAMLRKENLDIIKKGTINKIGASFINLIGLGATLGWMGWAAYNGDLNIGQIVMFWQALNQGRSLVRDLFTGFDSLYNDLIFLNDLFDFLELEPQVIDPKHPKSIPPGLNRSVTLNNISFKYPGSEKYALHNFDLTIPSGKFVAIVGENGAGKSTLIKLLCRFYDPEQGNVLWDGIDVREMAQSDLRKRITVLFQQPLSYFESVRNNIRYGDLKTYLSDDQIKEAAISAGADVFIQDLPDSYETILGKQFGNSDLSIGQWQRLALARSFVRKAEFIILDEPTSAMDSWAEAHWMENFHDLAKDRTSLVITHRFTTAMKADIIHVMANGKIIESGNHQQLLELNGHYAFSWKKQTNEIERRIRN